jgi:hypothetical protein
MHRQNAEDFLLTLLDEGVDRSQAIRQLFEDVAGE